MTPRRFDWWRPYLGIPVVWRGGSLETGLDCYDLVERVLPAEFGQPVDLVPAFSRDELRARIEAAKEIEVRRKLWRAVPWQEGAVCLWKIRGRPIHVGICLKTADFLHADWDSGVVQVSGAGESRWSNRFEGCYLPR